MLSRELRSCEVQNQLPFPQKIRPSSYPLSSVPYNVESLNVREPTLQISLSYASSPYPNPNFGNLLTGKESTTEEKDKAAHRRRLRRRHGGVGRREGSETDVHGGADGARQERRHRGSFRSSLRHGRRRSQPWTSLVPRFDRVSHSQWRSRGRGKVLFLCSECCLIVELKIIFWMLINVWPS